MKYPQPHSLKKYYTDEVDVDRIHNMIKRGMKDPYGKFLPYLRCNDEPDKTEHR